MALRPVRAVLFDLDDTLFDHLHCAHTALTCVHQATPAFASGAFDTFSAAWDVLAGVTTAQLPPERQRDAKAAVMAAMYRGGDGPRHFRNVTQFIVGRLA